VIAKLFPDLISGIWAIKRESAEGYLPLIISFLKNPGSLKNQDYSEERLEYSRMNGIIMGANKSLEYYELTDEGGRLNDNIPENSVVTLNINGAITKYNQFCGPVGMNTQISRLRLLDSHPSVAAILLNIDSPGGEGYAARSMAEAVQKTNKPVVSFINDMAASAAYMIASASDEIYANSDMAEIGSIGTYIQVADFRKQLENEGINLHEIYASASIDKNLEYKEAINGNYEPMRQFANSFNDKFIAMVNAGREGKLTADDKTWGTGKIFFAPKALDLGMIDGILSHEETLQTIFENLI
jgi:signal peptide peptidase SppA